MISDENKSGDFVKVITTNPLEDIEKGIGKLLKEKADLTVELDKTQNNFDAKKAVRDALKEFIVVADDFDDFLKFTLPKLNQEAPDVKTCVSKIKFINQRLKRAMLASKVTEILVTIGQKLDVNFNIAKETLEDPQLQDETVTEILKKGYLLEGTLLREAEVKVVKNN